jgi:hypothetical protein
LQKIAVSVRVMLAWPEDQKSGAMDGAAMTGPTT